MKNRVKTVVLGLFLILISQSCTKEKAINSESVADSVIVPPKISADSAGVTNSIELDRFPMPPQVEGCSCYFSDTKENFENEQYIYVDDYGNSAYLQIAGKMIKIPMEEGDFDPSNFNKSIENSDFKVKMSGKKVNEMDEVMMFAGEMAVENKKTGDKTTSPIYGECGC